MSLIDEILERFGVPRPRRRPALSGPHLYELGGEWGDMISWRRDGVVVGWKKRLPEVGDILRAPMSSGRMGLFEFTGVRRPGDPPDMFFADVAFVGYEGSS